MCVILAMLATRYAHRVKRSKQSAPNTFDVMSNAVDNMTKSKSIWRRGL